MKKYQFFTMAASFLAVCLNAGCSSNSSTGSNNNNGSNQTSFDGAPYLALSDNETFTGHLTGTIKYLDTSGNVMGVDQIDQVSSETIGALENHNGFLGRAIYFPNINKQIIGYIGSSSDTSDVIGFRQQDLFGGGRWTDSTETVTMIPKDVIVGKEWSPAPYPISCQVILQDHLTQFTSQAGKSYSDVLKFSVTYLDSAANIPSFNVYKGNATLFFANGIGLVEADIADYEHIQYDATFPYYLFSFHPSYHQIGSGTATKN